ncbi:hypothetical protein PI125_g23157, partial [Phytophthora idaei]
MDIASDQSSDIYGTFDGRQINGEALPSIKSFLLRVAAIAGVLVVLIAGYVSSSGFQTVNSIVEFCDEDGACSGDSLLYHNVVLETELNDVEQQLVDGVDAAHIREYLHEYSKK